MRYNRLTMIELSDLIPLWCEGIDPAFWTTKRGRDFAQRFWLEHCDEAMTINRAAQLVYNVARPSKSQCLRIRERFTLYLIPDDAIDNFISYANQTWKPRYYVLDRDIKQFICERSR